MFLFFHIVHIFVLSDENVMKFFANLKDIINLEVNKLFTRRFDAFNRTKSKRRLYFRNKIPEEFI